MGWGSLVMKSGAGLGSMPAGTTYGEPNELMLAMLEVDRDLE